MKVEIIEIKNEEIEYYDTIPIEYYIEESNEREAGIWVSEEKIMRIIEAIASIFTSFRHVDMRSQMLDYDDE